MAVISISSINIANVSKGKIFLVDTNILQRYPIQALRDFIEQGLLTPADRIAVLGAINGTGATFLEINAVKAILENV